MRVIQEALTFDDVLLIPAHSSVLPRDVSLKTQLTRQISLNIPLLSAAMDTVTEGRLAITIAQEGGIGIIQMIMNAERQAYEVSMVKKYESGVIKDPFTVSPDATIRDVLELTRAKGISGVPVVDRGDLVGIVTSRDLRFETRLDEPVSRAMTPKQKLITVKEGSSKEEAIRLLHDCFASVPADQAHLGERSTSRTQIPKMLQKEQKKSTRRSIFLQPGLLYRATELTVGDVHSDFEAETQISCCRCSPCHVYLLVM